MFLVMHFGLLLIICLMEWHRWSFCILLHFILTFTATVISVYVCHQNASMIACFLSFHVKRTWSVLDYKSICLWLFSPHRVVFVCCCFRWSRTVIKLGSRSCLFFTNMLICHQIIYYNIHNWYFLMIKLLLNFGSYTCCFFAYRGSCELYSLTMNRIYEFHDWITINNLHIVKPSKL